MFSQACVSHSATGLGGGCLVGELMVSGQRVGWMSGQGAGVATAAVGTHPSGMHSCCHKCHDNDSKRLTTKVRQNLI